MKKDRNTGMVRKVDSLGRIVLPIEMRRILGIEVGDPFEYFLDETDDKLILRRYRSQECMFCSSIEEVSYFRDYFICRTCLNQIPTYVNSLDRDHERPVLPPDETDYDHNEISQTKKQVRREGALMRLTKVMEQYPSASQQKWAEILGISQGRVSQMKKQLKEKNK
ncbi:hypothetical protein ASD24_24270 [Paenibacillus sp. Root52]|uniref:AbrB/MazE/SpoVT family DNA-binding domain-containing protein n=1 Tax=Paenibacillus sp. Root52 TaxID=1736552 RepID=UPI0006FF3A46|nr:AbrB/MazE/SpoVT family DNA-binding domain-containing protein [Paenibacillus sp. Root52]KQY90917.1 hypothetical protein ASD24_24270 [Paenibacillus sp. Root52]